MSLLCSAFNCIDCDCVNTGSIVINKKTLTTSFVNTCSVLTFKFNNDKNYMAHVDDFDDSMENRLYSSLLHIVEYLPTVKNFYVYKGKLCNSNCKSFDIIMRTLEKFNVKNIIIKHVIDNIKVEIK